MKSRVPGTVLYVDTRLNAWVLQQAPHQIIILTLVNHLHHQRGGAIGVELNGIRGTVQQSIQDVKRLSKVKGAVAKPVRAINICAFLGHQPQHQWHAFQVRDRRVQGRPPPRVLVVDASGIGFHPMPQLCLAHAAEGEARIIRRHGSLLLFVCWGVVVEKREDEKH